MQSKLGQAHSLTPALHQLTTHIVLTVYNTYPHSQAVVLGKGGAWPRRSQNGGGLPIVTMPADHTKNTKRLTCVDPYQTLPRSVLAERNPLAD